MSNSAITLSFQNEKADNVSFKLTEFSNSSDIVISKISQLETILECKCAETDVTHKAADSAREVEMLKEFDHRLKVELGQIKQRYEILLSREQSRAWCAMKEANRDRRDKMAALRSQLECRHIAGLMFVICAERNKCHRLRSNILADFDLHVSKLEEVLANRQLIIEEMCKACKKSSEVDQEWRQRMKRLIQEFQKFITYTLNTTPEASQYLLDVEKLMDCNSIKYQEIDGEPVHEEEIFQPEVVLLQSTVQLPFPSDTPLMTPVPINEVVYTNDVPERPVLGISPDIATSNTQTPHVSKSDHWDGWKPAKLRTRKHNALQVFDYKDYIGDECFCPNLEEVIEEMGEDLFIKWMDPAENPPPERVEQVLYGELGNWSSERPERYNVEPTDSAMTRTLEQSSNRSNGGVLAAKDSTEIMSSSRILKKNGSRSRKSSTDTTNEVHESNISLLLSTANIRLHGASKKSNASVRIDRSILKIREGPGNFSADSHIHTLVQNAETAMKDNEADPDGPRMSKLALMHTDSLEVLSQKHMHMNGGKVFDPSDDMEYINRECPAKSCYEKRGCEQPEHDSYEQFRSASLPPYLQTDELRQNESYEPCTLEQLNDLIRKTKDIDPAPELSRDSFLEPDGRKNVATSTEKPQRAKDHCECYLPGEEPRKKKLNASGDKELLDFIPQSRLFDKKVEFNRFKFLGNVYTKILTDRKESSASQSPELMAELLESHPSLCELMCDI